MRRADGADQPERLQWRRCEQVEAVVELQFTPDLPGTDVWLGIVRLVNVQPFGGNHLAAVCRCVTPRDLCVDAPVSGGFNFRLASFYR